jgi:phosphinothricin acetyltransferase
VTDTPALRLAEARDASACRAIYAPAILERSTSFEYNVPSESEMARRIAAVEGIYRGWSPSAEAR